MLFGCVFLPLWLVLALSTDSAPPHRPSLLAVLRGPQKEARASVVFGVGAGLLLVLPSAAAANCDVRLKASLLLIGTLCTVQGFVCSPRRSAHIERLMLLLRAWSIAILFNGIAGGDKRLIPPPDFSTWLCFLLILGGLDRIYLPRLSTQRHRRIE